MASALSALCVTFERALRVYRSDADGTQAVAISSAELHRRRVLSRLAGGACSLAGVFAPVQHDHAHRTGAGSADLPAHLLRRALLPVLTVLPIENEAK